MMSIGRCSVFHCAANEFHAPVPSLKALLSRCWPPRRAGDEQVWTSGCRNDLQVLFAFRGRNPDAVLHDEDPTWPKCQPCLAVRNDAHDLDSAHLPDSFTLSSRPYQPALSPVNLERHCLPGMQSPLSPHAWLHLHETWSKCSFCSETSLKPREAPGKPPLCFFCLLLVPCPNPTSNGMFTIMFTASSSPQRTGRTH